MKITIENYGKIFSFESEQEDWTLEDLNEIIDGLLIAIGYHPDTVKESREK